MTAYAGVEAAPRGRVGSLVVAQVPLPHVVRPVSQILIFRQQLKSVPAKRQFIFDM